MRAMIRGVTEVRAAPLVPEVRLHLAPEPLAPWEATERHAGGAQRPPFWAHAWPGGLALARAVLDAPELVRGRHVLDFASGCGVSAIAAVQAGALDVLATEVDPFAVAAIELNAALNGVSLRTTGDDVIGRDVGWDVVLVGDVFYQRELSLRVMGWLERLHARGAEVRIGDPGRSFLPSTALEVVATYAVAPVPAWDSVVDRPARVWRLRGR
jgi:predicted nicotinamide N-methyase